MVRREQRPAMAEGGAPEMSNWCRPALARRAAGRALGTSRPRLPSGCSPGRAWSRWSPAAEPTSPSANRGIGFLRITHRAETGMDFEETRRQWAEQLMDQASAAYRQEQYPRAIEMLTRALALDPGQSERIEAGPAADQRVSRDQRRDHRN